VEGGETLKTKFKKEAFLNTCEAFTTSAEDPTVTLDLSAEPAVTFDLSANQLQGAGLWAGRRAAASGA